MILFDPISRTRGSMVALALVVATATPLASSQTSAPAATDPVLMENSIAQVRKSDYDIELLRMPPNVREGFPNSERRVGDLVRRLLTERTLAALAREEKLDKLPENARRIEVEAQRVQMQLKLAKIEADAAAEFEAKRPAYEARAKELYTVDRAKYTAPEQFFASHILFDVKSRSREEALKLAQAARARVVAGADFNQVAREVSEDSTVKRNHGKLDWFTAAEMDPAFASAVQALKNPGDISEPVLSQFGYHVIKLEARRPAAQKPFEEARTQILAELRQRFINEQRDAALAKVRNDPATRSNKEAIDALVIRVDPNAVRRAAQEFAPGSTAPPSK